MDVRSVHPQLTYLFGALLLAAALSNAINVFVLIPAGFESAYEVVTTVAFMTPVVVVLSIYFDERGERYRAKSRTHHVGDAFFMLVGAVVGTGAAVAVLLDAGIEGFARDLVAMVTGFFFGWIFFWWRNRDVYVTEE